MAFGTTWCHLPSAFAIIPAYAHDEREMPAENLREHCHTHDFAHPNTHGERGATRVAVLTALMMAVEIAGGLVYGSMALLADGWHMGTHVAALGITVFAYTHARRHVDDPRYSFGTGKIGVLGGFASAVALAVVALFMAGESIVRMFAPVAIRFDEAIVVAALGLAVNVLSAFMLRGHHDEVGRETHAHDHNLAAAYLHVLADALTSILAIVALLFGKALGWIWMDAVMGMVGALVIMRWSGLLIRDTSAVLLDGSVAPATVSAIRSAIESHADNRVADLHVWRIGPRHLAAIVSVVTAEPRGPEHYQALLSEFDTLAHVTVEVRRRPGEPPARPAVRTVHP